MKNPFLKEFENLLYSYPSNAEAVSNMNRELEEIKISLTDIKSSNPTSYTGSGNSDYNVVENRILNLISKEDMLTDQILKAEADKNKVEDSLNYLDDYQKKLITLKFFEKKSHEKIADIMYCDKSTVSRHIHIAIATILLNRYWVK